MRPNIGTTKDEIIHSMSDAMRRIGEGCTERDLLLLGFTRQQIERYGDAAREMAFERSNVSLRTRVLARRAA